MKTTQYRLQYLAAMTGIALSFAANAVPGVPQTQSCSKVNANIVDTLKTSPKNYVIRPVLISNRECYVQGITTRDSFPNQVYDELHSVAAEQTSYILDNFRESMTQEFYNFQANANMDKIVRLDAQYNGSIHLLINGTVDNEGFVPVIFDNFGLEANAKMTDSVVNLYVTFRLDDMKLYGKYNVFTKRLYAHPDRDKLNPVVTVDVKLPYILKVLDRLTPQIIKKLQEEAKRLVSRIVESLGFDMAVKVPEAVRYNANIRPDVLVPIRALDGKNVGDSVFLEMTLGHGAVTVRDNQSDIRIFKAPFCQAKGLCDSIEKE
ncbi:hypothetical protein [Rheinheimera texasensis]|uniref:hypothetical protein n=1 Tax=Rheinheimera texasensis TaxID=306205 RepID=UPI0032B16744